MPVPRWARVACDNQCFRQECVKKLDKLHKCSAQYRLIDEAGRAAQLRPSRREQSQRGERILVVIFSLQQTRTGTRR